MAREKHTMRVRMRQIIVGTISKEDRVLGLGEDNRVYYYTSEGWKLLKLVKPL